MKLLLILFTFLLLHANLSFAEDLLGPLEPDSEIDLEKANPKNNEIFFSGQKSGFYSGTDFTKINPQSRSIDNSLSPSSRTVDNSYYGYKFSDSGFFVAPELWSNSSNQSLNAKLGGTTATKSKAPSPSVNYNVNANVGYEFNKSLAGFVTYDVGNFSYNSNQKTLVPGTSQNAPTIGVGSQIKLSKDFGVKLSYSQQQFENSSTSQGQIKSDIIKFGTVYGF